MLSPSVNVNHRLSAEWSGGTNDVICLLVLANVII